MVAGTSRNVHTPSPVLRLGWRRQAVLTLGMIKIEHSIFALPFALTGALLAWRDSGYAIPDLWSKLAWIVVAMVGARSAAMAFNRVLDARIDALNPRTSMRHIPAGLVTRQFAWIFTLASGLVLVLASAMLNPLCFALSPVALAVVLGYSYTKRFTAFSHLVLGFALGIAPAAAWIAVRGSLDGRIVLLTLAVLCWTAGFDIIYSCQDAEFDRRTGLYSVPARLGIAKGLLVSRILHVVMVGLLIALLLVFDLGGLSALGVVLVAGLLVYEHSLISAHDLTRVNAAFFTVNGYVSLLFALCWAAEIVWQRRGL